MVFGKKRLQRHFELSRAAEEISKCRVNVLPDQGFLGNITLKCDNLKIGYNLQTKIVTLTQDLIIYQ